MSQSPVRELQSRTGVRKSEDETVREYVRRVGAESDVDPDTVEGALTYITEWHYSDAPPEDDEAFRTLLRAAATDRDPDAAGDDPDQSTGNAARAGTQPPDRSPETPPGEEAVDESRSAGGGQTGSMGDLPDREPADESDPGPDRAREEQPSSDDASGRQPGGRAEREGPLGFKSGLRGSEPRKLLVRFVAIVATAPVIGWLMTRVWTRGNPFYEQIRAILARITGFPAPAAVDIVAVFVFGLYASLLVLFVVDVKKRVQGMLLLLGTVLALSTVGLLGVFFPSLELTAINALSLGLGFAVGLVLESEQLAAVDLGESTFQRPTLESGRVPEFRYAAMFLFGLVAVAVVATLAQAFVTGAVRVLDVPAVAVFLVLLYQFVQYESETDYMTLGPERSGKSMLLLGLCLELLRRSETHPNPNSYLRQGLERASNLQPGQERWPIPSTAPDEIRAASFEVIAGYYFPRRLELTALDYAGQHLGRVAEALATGGSPDPDGGVPQRVASRVAEADTLFFVLDTERLVYPEEFQEPGATDRENISWGLDHYTTILEHIEPDDVIVIATKCDILIDGGVVSPPSEYDSYSLFGDAVTDHLLARPDVQELLGLTGTTEVHPVYYETETRDGEYVPRLDGDGNLIPVGYDHLIDEIRHRQ